MSEKKELKILEDYLEYVHQHTDGDCPVCHAEDYPVNGDKRGYDEVLPENAEEWNCDHDEDCAVTVIEKFITAWNSRPLEAELAGAFIKAVQDEPEMPGGMPDEMWEAIKNDRDACNVAIQTAVKLTKDGIIERFEQALVKFKSK